MPESEYSKDTDRTTDVQTHNQTPFSTIVSNHPKLLKGLTDGAFINASPIQVAALPTIIAGNDTVVEAKNGTGKTLTFVIPTLMRLKIEQSCLQTIILAPTREIAVQIQQCFKKVGQYMSDLKCEYFIGGTSVEVDKQKANGCQIAVGSPGRIKHLLNEHVLKGSDVKIFILDEVDRLFTDKNFTRDVRLIDAKLPKLKQMIVVSASIDKTDMSIYDEFMKEYTVVQGAEEDMNASQDPSKFLLGIKQYVACVKAVSTNIILLPAKNVRLLNILQNLPYTQCIIFTNYMTRVEAVCNMLRDHHYKADYIRGDQDQTIRLKLVDRLTSFQSKILVATDLIARGIDSSNVDLVINMDCPYDWATYLHRIGRAGRFGNKGNVFTILDDDKELTSFKCIINSIENVKIKMLPIVIQKPILEYEDNELEDLNLITVSNALTNNLTKGNENDTTKEDKEQSDSKFESSDVKSNISSSKDESKQEIQVKSIHRAGISSEESLQKLRLVVKETEKKIIEANLVNKKHLSADRSFVLFDPEPLLDDTEQYMKYSPENLVEIITKYDSDFEKYEAVKKSVGKEPFNDEQVANQSGSIDNKISSKNNDEESKNLNNCEEKHSTNASYSDNNLSNDLNSVSDSKINKTVCQIPRFTNIYDLFQIPDLSLLKSVQHHNTEEHSSNEKLTNEEESDVPSMICENGSEEYCDKEENGDEEKYYDEEEYCDEENYDDEEWSEVSEEEEIESSEVEEVVWSDEFDEVELNDIKQNYNEGIKYKSLDGSIEDVNSSYNKHDNHQKPSVKRNDKPIKISIYNNDIQENVIPQRVVNEIENDDQQLVDYDVLDDWYQKWKQQMGIIQSCVRLSK